MNALAVQGLTKDYPHFRLDNISFAVAEGHIAGLIGGNGAGKSTLLKGIVNQIDAEGEITVFGKNTALGLFGSDWTNTKRCVNSRTA